MENLILKNQVSILMALFAETKSPLIRKALSDQITETTEYLKAIKVKRDGNYIKRPRT